MSKKIAELKETLQALTETIPNRETFGAAHLFLNAHLDLARAAKASDPALAVEQYKCAEACQGCIGTFATGSGEGLASMAALYDIMAERAELEELMSNTVKRIEEKIRHLQQALSIWEEIHRDPNLDELLPQKDTEPLKQQLQAWKSMKGQ